MVQVVLTLYNAAETLVESLSIESHNTTCSRDGYVASLCKDIEENNSRIEVVGQKYDQTCAYLTKLISSLVQEVEHQKERINELEQECKKKDATCKSTSRILVSLLKEVDCKHEQIADLKHTCSEMYSDIRKLMEERDAWHKLYIQGLFLFGKTFAINSAFSD